MTAGVPNEASSYRSEYYARQKTRFRAAAEKYRHTESGYKSVLLNSLRARAKKKGLQFSLTVDTVPWADKCPAFGTALAYKPNKFADRWKAPSVVRLDPEKGYVPGNVQVVSFQASPLAIALADAAFELRDKPVKRRESFARWVSRQIEARRRGVGDVQRLL